MRELTPGNLKAIVRNNPEPIRQRLSTLIDVGNVISIKDIADAISIMQNQGRDNDVFYVLNVPFTKGLGAMNSKFEAAGGLSGQSFISAVGSAPADESAGAILSRNYRIPTKTLAIVAGLFLLGIAILIYWTQKK